MPARSVMTGRWLRPISRAVSKGSTSAAPRQPESAHLEVSWCEQKWTGLCGQKWNNVLDLLPDQVNPVISAVASAEDRALRGRNPSAV